MKIIILLLLASCLNSCGQLFKDHKHQILKSIETNKLSNLIVKNAFEAWQEGNSTKWLSFFTDDAELLDDGKTRNFKKFSTEAIGKERFISIDTVQENGLLIYGQFHSDTWGDFKTYFKFHINKDGKFNKLEIGQVK